MSKPKRQSARSILSASQCRFFKLSPKLLDPDDEIGKQEIITTITTSPFRTPGCLKESEDRVGVLKRYNRLSQESQLKFTGLLSKTFVSDSLELEVQKIGGWMKQLNPYLIYKSKLKNLPKEYQNILRDNRPIISHSFNHKGNFYAINLRSFRLQARVGSETLNHEFSMGWARFLTQRLDTVSIREVMRQCVAREDGKLKIEDGKLFKKCKGANAERQYLTIEEWVEGGVQYKLESPLIEIINPEIEVFEVVIPENQQVLLIIERGMSEVFPAIRKRASLDKLLEKYSL